MDQLEYIFIQEKTYTFNTLTLPQWRFQVSSELFFISIEQTNVSKQSHDKIAKEHRFLNTSDFFSELFCKKKSSTSSILVNPIKISAFPALPPLVHLLP